MDRTLAGKVVDIDDEIAAWHSAPRAPDLPTWLGMTDAEYATFVERPAALPAIVAKRATGITKGAVTVGGAR